MSHDESAVRVPHDGWNDGSGKSFTALHPDEIQKLLEQACLAGTWAAVLITLAQAAQSNEMQARIDTGALP
jgi:hypothetical protein